MRGDYYYHAERDETRKADDLYIVGYTIEHFILMMNVLSKYNDLTVMENDSTKTAINFIRLLGNRIDYFSNFAFEEPINDTLVNLGAINYSFLLKNWKKLENDLKRQIPSFSDIEPMPGSVEMRASERLVVENIIESLYANMPSSKNLLRFNSKTGDIVFNGIKEKVVDLGTIKGVLLKAVIMARGRPVKEEMINGLVEELPRFSNKDKLFDGRKSKSFVNAVDGINNSFQKKFLTKQKLINRDKNIFRLSKDLKIEKIIKS